jgi:signal transduction histidine kinase
MRSIERYLLAWIMGALLLGSVLVALVTYMVTLEEMNEVFDADLRNVAEGVASYHRFNRESLGELNPVLPARSDEPEDSEIVTLTWSNGGRLVYASDPRVHMPFVNVEGLSHLKLGGEDWIVYTTVRNDGVAQAAQRVSARHQMAGESAAKILPPLLALAVIVGGLLIFGLRRGLQPLDGAAHDVADRSVRSLDPISTADVPREIAPLVVSINDLMGRLSEAFTKQRRFLADAAHELRAPVTALRLQLQLLQRSSDGASREAALAELQAGVARSQRLIEQLLQVARSEPDAETAPTAVLDLSQLARVAVGSFSVKADFAHIDLGADAPEAVEVLADGEQLTVLLNNLVENALRYTPEGGIVDLKVGLESQHPVLRVIDNGPGIPEAERERVFDRFYRGKSASVQQRDGGGSGLGLAIVQAIAERHGAKVSLHTPDGQGGLEVRVSFPAQIF